MRKVSAKENDKRGGKLRKTKWNLTEDRKKVQRKDFQSLKIL